MKINNSDSINDKILDDNNNNNRSNSSSSSSSESENKLINDLLKKHLESEMNSHEFDENQEGTSVELARARVEYPGQPDSTHKFYSTRISVGRKPSSPTPNKSRPIHRQSSNLQIRNSTFVSREHFVIELVGFYSISILKYIFK